MIADVSWTVTIPCPACHLGQITAVMHPGEPVDYHAGGGAGVSIDWIEDQTCQCENSVLVDKDKYRAAVEEAAAEAFVEEL